MTEEVLQPYDLVVKRGAAKSLRPRITASVGIDMSSWIAELVIKGSGGSVIFTVESPITTELDTLHIGSADLNIPAEDTAKFELGHKQSYYVRVRDLGGWDDIIMHGLINAIVVAGGV